jgi:4-hydroxyphenylpyruvate dioxygenase
MEMRTMGIPVEPGQRGRHANPAGTRGLAFVEFSAAEPGELARLFTEIGFVRSTRPDNRNITYWHQGGVRFVLNCEPDTHGGQFFAEHGPCISALGFHVEDAQQAFDRALAFGATSYAGQHRKVFDERAIVGIGGTLLYLVDDTSPAVRLRAEGAASDSRPTGVGIKAVDHLTHNVRAGSLEEWADFYTRIFGFREVFYLSAKGAATGFRTRALKSPCDGICIPINEPTDPKSQIQEYIDTFKGEGVQHLAFATRDLPATIEQLSSRIPFMSIPATYYEQIDARLPGHGEHVERLKRNGILLDGTRNARGGWDLLLQIFSKNVVGPTFFEFIQRKGNEGFGEGNARALFEAIERDQMERGVVRT